jgi:hypothetical protein
MVSVTWGIVRGGAVEKGGRRSYLSLFLPDLEPHFTLTGRGGGGMIGRRNVVAGLVATGRVGPGGEAGRPGSLTRGMNRPETGDKREGLVHSLGNEWAGDFRLPVGGKVIKTAVSTKINMYSSGIKCKNKEQSYRFRHNAE